MSSMREQRADLLNEARKLAGRAIAEGRDLRPNEKDQIEGCIKSVDQLDITIAAAEASRAKLDRLAAITHPEADPGSYRGVELFTPQDKAGLVNAARTRTSYAADIDHVSFKAAIGSGTLIPTSGTTVSGYPIGTGAVALRQLFTPVQSEGPTVRYYQIGQATAAVVAEGAAKPDCGVAVAAVDASLVKIASTFKITDELREDAGFLIGAITSEVLAGTIRKENAEIVQALTGASGVLTASGAVADALECPGDRDRRPGGRQRRHAECFGRQPGGPREHPQGEGQHRRGVLHRSARSWPDYGARRAGDRHRRGRREHDDPGQLRRGCPVLARPGSGRVRDRHG